MTNTHYLENFATTIYTQTLIKYIMLEFIFNFINQEIIVIEGIEYIYLFFFIY